MGRGHEKSVERTLVTGPNGAFEITLPPGVYGIAAGGSLQPLDLRLQSFSSVNGRVIETKFEGSPPRCLDPGVQDHVSPWAVAALAREADHLAGPVQISTLLSLRRGYSRREVVAGVGFNCPYFEATGIKSG
jgi:hypothetical protein